MDLCGRINETCEYEANSFDITEMLNSYQSTMSDILFRANETLNQKQENISELKLKIASLNKRMLEEKRHLKKRMSCSLQLTDEIRYHTQNKLN
jgi:peptidoglycan hydrolase CwlO-like protein